MNNFINLIHAVENERFEVLPNGATYSGAYLPGTNLFHGEGLLTLPNKTMYEARFHYGQPLYYRRVKNITKVNTGKWINIQERKQQIINEKLKHIPQFNNNK